MLNIEEIAKGKGSKVELTSDGGLTIELTKRNKIKFEVITREYGRIAQKTKTGREEDTIEAIEEMTKADEKFFALVNEDIEEYYEKEVKDLIDYEEFKILLRDEILEAMTKEFQKK